MHCWKYLTESYKVTSNEHRKNMTSRPSKWSRKKEEKKSKEETRKYTERLNAPYQEEIRVRTLRRKSGQNVLSVRTLEIGMIQRSNAEKKIRRVYAYRSNTKNTNKLWFER